jgi:hypothetical protein
VARLEVAKGLVSSALLVGAEPTGPRSAVALSMPGLRPTAFPPDGGGGGLNGSAGLAKLVTPGAADGVIACTGGLDGIAGADGVSAAAAGGANIPIAGGCDCGNDGDTGAWLVTLANGEIPDMPLLVFGADNGDWLTNEPACEAPDVAGEIAAVTACSVALITADIIDIPALAPTSAAAIAGAATEPPATDGNAESPDNAAPNASNPAP